MSKILTILAACVVLHYGSVLVVDSTGSSQPTGATSGLHWGKAVVLGIVEGLTEYLPVSSTGHLLITERIMGLTRTAKATKAADAYAIIIQIGAIIAVFGIYRKRILEMIRGLLGRDSAGLRLAMMLVLAFLPAAILGPILEHTIKSHLFGPWPIIAGWFVGGVAIFFKSNNRGQETVKSTEGIRWQHALIIGLFQVTAMWPGVSRSLATIMGGMIAGLGIATAVEFSFLLGLITLGAATTYEMMHLGGTVITAYGVGPSLTGIVCSLVAAWLSVKWLLSYVQNRGLNIFGYYRILLAAVIAVLVFNGVF